MPSSSDLPQLASSTRLVLRPLANPLSLGFVGLFFATMLFAGLELGWVPASQAHALAIAVLVFTVPVQFIACVYGFLTRDSVAATGFGVLAGIWGATAINTVLARGGSHSAALGLILVIGAAAVCAPAVGAAPSKAVAAAVLFTVAVRWGATAGYEFSGGDVWKLAAGAAGLLLGAMAFYACLAFELEDQTRQTRLPTLRRGAGEMAMTGDLAAQVSRAANEAGVRQQL